MTLKSLPKVRERMTLVRDYRSKEQTQEHLGYRRFSNTI